MKDRHSVQAKKWEYFKSKDIYLIKSLGDGLEATAINTYVKKTSSYLKHNTFRGSEP